MYGLEISGLTVDFGKFKLGSIDLNIRRGCITGLVGRNGAGKSTLIKTIMRQQEANAGRILYNGLRFSEHEVEVLNSVACVFDSPHFDLAVKPKTMLRLYRSAFPAFNVQLYQKLMDKFSLPSDKRIGKFSFGMQRKYCLILALCQGADILLLDEPTSGIDPFDRGEVVSLVQEYLMDENHTVLFSTHITEDLDKIADYIVMLDDGKVVLDEDKITLTESYRLVQCENLTPDLAAGAIGVRKNMFGYTFLTRDRSVSEGEGIKVKTPTVEEIFVHMLGNGEH